MGGKIKSPRGPCQWDKPCVVIDAGIVLPVGLPAGSRDRFFGSVGESAVRQRVSKSLGRAPDNTPVPAKANALNRFGPTKPADMHSGASGNRCRFLGRNEIRNRWCRRHAAPPTAYSPAAYYPLPTDVSTERAGLYIRLGLTLRTVHSEGTSGGHRTRRHARAYRPIRMEARPFSGTLLDETHRSTCPVRGDSRPVGTV